MCVVDPSAYFVYSPFLWTYTVVVFEEKFQAAEEEE